MRNPLLFINKGANEGLGDCMTISRRNALTSLTAGGMALAAASCQQGVSNRAAIKTYRAFSYASQNTLDITPEQSPRP